MAHNKSNQSGQESRWYRLEKRRQRRLVWLIRWWMLKRGMVGPLLKTFKISQLPRIDDRTAAIGAFMALLAVWLLSPVRVPLAWMSVTGWAAVLGGMAAARAIK